jgi:hypothetical protein
MSIPPMLDGMVKICELKENPLKKKPREGIRVA